MRSGVGRRGGCCVWRLWRHIRPVGRASNKLLEARLSGEVLKKIYSHCGQKNNLWQYLPGRMTFWCSSQQIGRAVGQGAFPLLPRYPSSEQAVSHFWPFLLFGIILGVVILPNSKLLCVLMHGRSCSPGKDLTPLIRHFHFHLSLSLSLCQIQN